MATTRTKASNDFTGRQAKVLADEAAREQEQKAAEMAMMTATTAKEFENTVQDMTVRPDAPTVIDDVVEMGVVLADDSIVVRVAEDVDSMTYGHGNTYTFTAGGKYKVPRGVAERLEDLGLLYERL
jgi:hypothetical protein